MSEKHGQQGGDARLREALEAIREALKEPSGGSYWPARKFLDDRNVYNDDLNNLRVLRRVAEVALQAAAPAAAVPHDEKCWSSGDVIPIPSEEVWVANCKRFRECLVRSGGNEVAALEEYRKPPVAQEPPTGEQLRDELISWLEKNGIVSVLFDTAEHTVNIQRSKLPPEMRCVLRSFGCIYVKEEAATPREAADLDKDGI